MTVIVSRGRASSVEADRAASRDLLDHTRDGNRAVRVWTPHRQVAFGRRDANRADYEAACTAARDHGFRPTERRVGGRAVAYDGETTLAFARAHPVDDLRTGIQERYDAITADVADVLEACGVPVESGEPADSFCPGTHSLRLPDGPKVAGMAQRVTSDGALVAGILIVDDGPALAAVLDDVYTALDVPLDPDSVGDVAHVADVDPDGLRGELEERLVGEREPTRVRPIGE